jgi:prepilin-type processing-associated H-X9-DG protein
VDRAFTIIEVTICLVAVAILLILSYAAIRVLRPRVASISCDSRLREIGLSFRTFATSHADNFPMTLGEQQGGTSEWADDPRAVIRHFGALQGILPTPARLVCPQDSRLPAQDWAQVSSTNISYFVGLAANPDLPRSILAGDRNITAFGPAIFLWHTGVYWRSGFGLHGTNGNILFADGHVELLSSSALTNAFQALENAANRLAVP